MPAQNPDECGTPPWQCTFMLAPLILTTGSYWSSRTRMVATVSEIEGPAWYATFHTFTVSELFMVVNWQTFEGLWGWIVGKTLNGLYILIGT